MDGWWEDVGLEERGPERAWRRLTQPRVLMGTLSVNQPVREPPLIEMFLSREIKLLSGIQNDQLGSFVAQTLRLQGSQWVTKMFTLCKTIICFYAA